MRRRSLRNSSPAGSTHAIGARASHDECARLRSDAFVGGRYWPEPLPTFDAEIARFHEMLADLAHELDQGTPFRGEIMPERLLQGPFADTMTHVTIVRAAGGTNLYAFNLPIVRAELDIDAVPELVGRGSSATTVDWVKTVVDPANHDVSVFVGLTRELTDADIAAAEALGARVTRRFDFINAFVIDIDDARRPLVRKLPDVRHVEENGLGCVG